MSNAHNRAGEAEKSHQKAKAQGFRGFWTVIAKKGLSMETLQAESPTTQRWFDAAHVLGQNDCSPVAPGPSEGQDSKAAATRGHGRGAEAGNARTLTAAGPARPGAEPTRKTGSQPAARSAASRPRRRGRSLTASRGGRCPAHGPGSPTRR